MTQALVRKNLIRYIRIVRPENKELLEKIEQMGGLCFGLSICHGAMDLTHYLDWHEEALIAIANWDGTPEQLDQVINLPNARNPQQPLLLKDIFEKMLHDVIVHQVIHLSSFKDFQLEGCTQLSILDPLNDYFSLLDQKDQIQKIQSRTIIPGYFTQAALMNLLNEESIENHLCLVHRLGHTIRLGYKNNKWILYDPNYEHTSKETIHKTFTHKQDLIKEIISIQGNSLAFEIVSFEKKDIMLSYYLEMLKNEPEQLLKGDGLFLIGKYAPQYLPHIITKSLESQHGKDIIVKALAHQYRREFGIEVIAQLAPNYLPMLLSVFENNPKEIKSLAHLISQKNLHGYTIWSILLLYAPAILPKILTMTYSHLDCHAMIGQALTENGINKWLQSLLQIIHHGPFQLFQLLRMTASTPQGEALMKEALTQQNNVFWTQLIRTSTLYSHGGLSQLLTIALNSPNHGISVILNAYRVHSVESWLNCIHTIQLLSPIHLSQIVVAANQSSVGLNAIIEELTKRDYAPEVIKRMMQYAPDQLSLLLPIIANQPSGPDLIAKALMIYGADQSTGLHALAAVAPSNLPQVIAFATQSTQGAQCVMTALTTQDFLNSSTGLFLVIQHGAQFLPNIFKLTATLPQTPKLLAQTLVLKNLQGWNSLHACAKFAPCSLSTLIDLISQSPDGLIFIVKALSARTFRGIRGWQMINSYASHHKEEIMDSLLRSIKKADIKTLLLFSTKLKKFLMENPMNSNGGSQSLTLFLQNTGRQENIWKILFAKLNNEISTRLTVNEKTLTSQANCSSP